MLPFCFTMLCAVLQFYARRFICRDFTGTTTTFIPKPFVRGVDSVKKEQFTPFLTWGYSRRHFLNVSTYSSHFSSLSQSFQSFCQVNYYGLIVETFVMTPGFQECFFSCLSNIKVFTLSFFDQYISLWVAIKKEIGVFLMFPVKTNSLLCFWLILANVKKYSIYSILN